MENQHPVIVTVASTLRRNTFLLMFLFSVPFGLLLYFNSSFLVERALSEQQVGLVLASGYALSVIIMLYLSTLLRRFGNRPLFIGGLILCGILFLLVSLTDSLLLMAIFLSAGIGVATSLYVLLDIFLAATSADVDRVGGRRGIFVTLRNGAYIVAQFIAIGILAYASFAHLYIVAATTLFLLAVVAYVLLRRFRDPTYEQYDWRGVWGRLRQSKNLRNIFFIEFLLRLFYSIMIVYTPLYLHEHIGIPFESMGLIFAIMIVPFILLEIPIGRLQDSLWGEQEVLMAGFLITSFTTAVLAFITTPNLLVWGIALFATRVGAALLDIGSQTYFFKQIHGNDSAEVSAFRVLFPIAYIVGPLLGASLLFILSFQYIFVALGALMLTGIISAYVLTDTK